LGRTFVNEPKFDAVPAGTYEVQLVAVEDRKPFEGGKYGGGSEPRLGWRFKVLSGPHQDKVIEQGTGTTLGGPKSRLTQLLTMMLGRKLAKGERVDGDALIGRRWQLVWAVNPESEKEYCHVVALTALPNGEAPPLPPRSLTPNDTGGGLFWVIVGEGQPPTSLNRAGVETLIKERNLDPRFLKVCPVGKQDWGTAEAHGFADITPF
jgi:hypothetical protein